MKFKLKKGEPRKIIATIIIICLAFFGYNLITLFNDAFFRMFSVVMKDMTLIVSSNDSPQVKLLYYFGLIYICLRMLVTCIEIVSKCVERICTIWEEKKEEK